MHKQRFPYIFIMILVLAALSYRFAAPNMIAVQSEGPDAQMQDQFDLPKAPYLVAMGLNYREFVADLLWIKALIYFGDFRLREDKKWQMPKHLGNYAQTIAKIDPGFYQVYPWFVATYLNTRPKVTAADIEEVNQLLDEGIKQFPTQYELPYMAGMNYIGYSADRKPKVRIQELERGIDYLQYASQLEGCPPHTPFVVSYMYNRKQTLEKRLHKTLEVSKNSKQEKIDFYLKMYQLSDSQDIKSRLAYTLYDLGISKKTLKDVDQAQTQKLLDARKKTFSYLPVDIWTTLATPE